MAQGHKGATVVSIFSRQYEEKGGAKFQKVGSPSDLMGTACPKTGFYPAISTHPAMYRIQREAKKN